MALLCIELGPQAAEVLRILACLVALTRLPFALALLVVEAFTKELGVPLYIR